MDTRGFTDLCKDKDVKAMEELLDMGFDVNEEIGQGELTGLTYAVYFGYTKMLRLFLERGADVNFKLGRDNLMKLACEGFPYGGSEMIYLLLEFGIIYEKEKVLIFVREKDRKIIEPILDEVYLKPAK